MGGLLPRPLAPHYNHVAPFYSCRIPVNANTIARTMSQAGYVTGHIKKMHVGGRSGGYPYPLTYGFDFSWGKHHDYNDPELWDKKMKHKLEYTLFPELLYVLGAWTGECPRPQTLRTLLQETGDSSAHQAGVDE